VQIQNQNQIFELFAIAAGSGPMSELIVTVPPGLEEALGVFTFGDLPGITGITFNQAHSIAGFDIESTSGLVTLSWPHLVDLDPTNIQGGFLTVSSNTALTSASLPLLIGSGSLSFGGNPMLTSVSLPSLVSTSELAFRAAVNLTPSAPNVTTVGFLDLSNGSGCVFDFSALATVTDGIDSDSATNVSINLPALVDGPASFYSPSTTFVAFNIPAYLPANGAVITFSGCNLTQPMVDQILARGVASAGYVTGTIDTSGGTSATPSVAGLANKAILIGRGITVNTN
jgi:hypothetical protein